MNMYHKYVNYDRRQAGDYYDFDDNWKMSVYINEDYFFNEF